MQDKQHTSRELSLQEASDIAQQMMTDEQEGTENVAFQVVVTFDPSIMTEAEYEDIVAYLKEIAAS